MKRSERTLRAALRQAYFAIMTMILGVIILSLAYLAWASGQAAWSAFLYFVAIVICPFFAVVHVQEFIRLFRISNEESADEHRREVRPRL